MSEKAENVGEDLVAKAKSDRARARGPIARIILFVRQVFAELKKVTTPTLAELRNYTFVVLGFVTVVMLIIFALDAGFGSLVIWVFTPTVAK